MSLSLGLSGATFGVVKRGIGCREQANYIERLGATCLPRLHQVHENGYEMEFLEKPARVIVDDETFRHIVGLLMEHIWCLPSSDLNIAWIGLLDTWLVQRVAPKILRDSLHALYPTFNVATCAIHGDPTLANLMQRADGRLVLMDPLPPGGKIPSLREVDLGKLLQSGCGWEQRLRRCCTIEESWTNRTTQWISMFRETQRRAWFWCAVHLWRVEPYAERANRPDVAAWAKDMARIICEKELR